MNGMNPWFWLAICLVLIIIELATSALTTIWFACGAAAALVVSLVFDSVVAECIVFAVVSAGTLLLFRPSCVRRFNRRRTATNVDSLVGKKARITETVNNSMGTGRAVVGGMEWAARSEDDTAVLPTGSFACVARVEGVKLVLKEKEEM